jgi:hypothetical protein
MLNDLTEARFREVKWLRRRFSDSATIQFPMIHLTQKLVPESSAEASAESTVKRLLWTLLMQPLVKWSSTNCNPQWNYPVANPIPSEMVKCQMQPLMKLYSSKCNPWWNGPRANATSGWNYQIAIQSLVKWSSAKCNSWVKLPGRKYNHWW